MQKKLSGKIYCFADSILLCRQLLDAGAEIIQLRAKDMDKDSFYKLAEEMKELILHHASQTLFIINDHADIALSLKTDGLHLGQDDTDYRSIIRKAPTNMIIGVSVKTVPQALDAEKNGADYVGAGAIFPTDTKKDSKIIGPQGIQKIAKAVNIPVVAIGGITLDNIAEATQCGADCFAVISAINQSNNIAKTHSLFRQQVQYNEQNK